MTQSIFLITTWYQEKGGRNHNRNDRATGFFHARFAEENRARVGERLLSSRWLMLPFYVGLVVSLAVLFLKFARILWEFILPAPGAKSTDTILDVLSLIDLTLVCS
jgi:hypothetical protein